MTENRPAAVLWDMDGTIVDTEPLWMRAETELIESYGGTWSHEQGLQLVGLGLLDSASILIAAGVRMAPQEIVEHLSARVRAELAETTALPWRPGALELFAALREEGIPSAIVTMSFRPMALQVAAGIGAALDDEGAVALVVAGDDGVRHKPDPEPYTRAAELLGVAIADCVALEDSVGGVASAASSGAATIAIPFFVPIPESPAYTRWPTLAGRGVDDLAGVLAAHRRYLDEGREEIAS